MALLLIGLMIAGQGLAQSAAVPYPQQYTTRLVKYAVVDRADGLSRDLYVSREGLDALRRNARLDAFPVGVVFALDVHQARFLRRDAKTGASVFARDAAGHLVRSADEPILHVMQKTAPGFGSHTWTFAGFEPVTAKPLALQLPGDCLLCHQAAVVSDMAFSMPLLKRYLETNVVQHSFCSHPGRQVCAF